MKVSPGHAVFQPFTVSIQFETAEEVAQFYALHNHTQIMEVLPAIDHVEICRALESHTSWSDAFPSHQRLMSLMKSPV